MVSKDKCDRLIAEMKQKLDKAPTGAVKWSNLEKGLKAAFTLDGKVDLEELFVDDSNKGRGTHYQYTQRDIMSYLEQTSALIESVRNLPSECEQKLSVSRFPLGVKLPHDFKDAWVAKALLSVSEHLQNASVIVFGSNTPTIESMVLQFDVSNVTVVLPKKRQITPRLCTDGQIIAHIRAMTDSLQVDYNKLTYQHPKIKTLRLAELLEEKPKFDVALSISSFDHDGLGRYNDPLDPDGDLKAMDLAGCLLEDDGILILTVPIGSDVLAWNAGRRYGAKRLPLLLKGWQNMSIVGWDQRRSGWNSPFHMTYEPAFVLRRTKPFDS